MTQHSGAERCRFKVIFEYIVKFQGNRACKRPQFIKVHKGKSLVY